MINTLDPYDEKNTQKWETFVEGFSFFPFCTGVGLILSAWIPGSLIQEPKTLVLACVLLVLAIIVDKAPRLK